MEPAPAHAPAPEWRSFLTDELSQDPVVARFAEKATEKDVAALIKSAAHAQHQLGTRVAVPSKDAPPDEVRAFRERLVEAGVLPAIPKSAAEYVARPASLPEGLQWNDQLAQRFGETLLKHGAPKALAEELLGLYTEALTGASKALKGSLEDGLTALRQENGEQYEPRMEAARRLVPAIFRTPEELEFFETLGLGNHPAFLSILLRLAPLALQDSSFLEQLPPKGGPIPGEDARAEYARILSDPSHPMYEALRRRDPKAERYVDDLYRRAYGSKQVDISQPLGT